MQAYALIITLANIS